MELSQLIQFITVAKYLNMRQAAEELYMAQPNISRAIKNLEEELNVALFERQKKRLSLTDDGQKCLVLAKEIIERTEELKKISKSGKNFDINIAGLGLTYFEIMVPRMNLLRREYNIFTHTLSNRTQMYNDLLFGKYDMLIDTRNENNISNEEIKCVKFITENLCVSVPSRNPLSKKKSLMLSELQNENFILSTHTEAQLSNELLHKSNLKITTEYTTDQPISGNRFIGSDGLVFDSILNKYYGIPVKERKLIPIDDESARYDVYMVYKVENEERLLPIINWIINFCKGINQGGLYG